MSRDRTKGRRAVSRAYRPAPEGPGLEPRLLMTGTPPTTRHPAGALVMGNFLLQHPEVGYAYKFNNPPIRQGSKAYPFAFGSQYSQGVADVQTARGGASVIVAAPDGSRFRISLTLAENQYDGGLSAQTGGTSANVIPSNVVQPKGTIRAYPMSGGRVGLIVDGDTQQMELTIDPLPFAQRRGYAHSFAYGEADRTHVLNIGTLQVNGSGISAILGFHSADLSGPLSIPATSTVDRIAFNNLLPGAAIGTGGTVNTLEVANSVTLDTGLGILVGGDLNLFNVGQNLTLTNGASLKVGRFIGLTLQPPKGTGTGSNILSLNQSLIGTGTSTVIPSVSGYVQGNFTIGPGSVFSSGSGVANSSITAVSTGSSPSPFVINGALNAYSNKSVVIPNVRAGTTFIGQGNVPNNLVARNGIHIAT